jgi:hypothetical protein
MFNHYGGNFTQSYEKVTIFTYSSMFIQPNIGRDEFIPHIHPSNYTLGGMNSSVTTGLTRPILLDPQTNASLGKRPNVNPSN